MMTEESAGKAHQPSAKARRSAARLCAVQALYQLSLSPGGVDDVIGEFAAHRFGAEVDGEEMVSPDPALFAEIVRGVHGQRAALDRIVDDSLSGQWSPRRLEQLLRVVLQAGIWELEANRAVPGPIVIAEYVGIAHAFFGGPEPSMVNAVLDLVAKRTGTSSRDPIV